MHNAATTSRFLIDISLREFTDQESPLRQRRLLHKTFATRLAQVSNTRRAFQEIGNYSIQAAEHAYCIRDMDTVQEAGIILMNLPIITFQQVGLYYYALAINRKGRRGHARKI
jgi:hypothetical protein